LHGSNVADEGSTWSAAYASGGRQTPRITWRGTSTSTFAFSVAAMSISVSTPKPWSARAVWLAVTASSYGRATVALRV
jgi:hypothetical protein